MKFFIVDNGSRLLEEIIARINGAGHDYLVQTYSPFEQLDPQDADMIILSGGMKNEVADDLGNGDPWYRHEFKLIRETNKPILGICLGLQMITVALGGSLQKLPALIESDSKVVGLNTEGQQHFNANQFIVHEKHQWAVKSYADTGLQLLGSSEDCIEILYHPARNIIGTQFHPEVDFVPGSEELFWQLIDFIAQPAGALR